MGGSQSRPSTPSDSPSSPSPHGTDRPALGSSRLSSFRRLSSLAKRNQRHLRGSTAGSSEQGGERKKRRVDEVSLGTGDALDSDEAGSSAMGPGMGVDSSPAATPLAPQPLASPTDQAPTPDTPTVEPAFRIPTPLPPPPTTSLGDLPVIPDPMPAPPSLFAVNSFNSDSGVSLSDPQRHEGLESLSNIRQSLGTDWPAPTFPSPQTTDGTVQRVRPHSVPNSSLPTAGEASAGFTERLTALLGFASPASASATTTTISDGELDQLSTRLQRAREDLDDAERRISEIRRERDETRRRLENRMPTGPMVVIQGLAQTHALPTSTEAPAGSSASSVSTAEEPERSRPFLRRMRRSSDGQVSRRAAARDEAEGTSIESQARMISGLLTVAAAATASTLLAPPEQAPNAPNRSGAAAALENLTNRLRPNRSRATGGVEEALGSYLRNALQNNHRSESSTSGLLPLHSTSGTSSEAISTEFESFISSLRDDLITAVRDYARPAQTDDHAEVSSLVPSTAHSTSTSSSTVSAPTAPGPPQGETTPIPTFHSQLGQQALSASRGRLDITGGADGQPRRLNFMRAHLFPAIHPERGNTTPVSTDDPDGVVPCLFIGVRSIMHDPAMSTDDLVQHPNFPFTNGEVPTAAPFQGVSSSASSVATDASEAGPTGDLAGLPSTVPAATSAPERRSLRERVIATLSRRTEQSPQRPLSTYLVYVIGGYYPRSHPVLSIPNLATGGPLSDEEMALVSELMGQVKPPTASKEDIENSGLTVVDGSEVKRMEQEGQLLSSCVERCLICLDEYEPGQECRILRCRHGYHKECVDHWLSNGRDSCPACRTAVVHSPSASADGAESSSTAVPGGPDAGTAA